MYANYHTHTYLCKHASGTPEEYVKEAIHNGIKILGFSDHNPCPFSEKYVSTFRMDVSETETYLKEISELREKYKEKIKILIGYEMEYYPKEFDNTIKLIKKYGADYLILGQHFTKNEYDGVYGGLKCDSETFSSYINQTIEGMKKGVFSYLAHPDFVHFTGDAKLYKQKFTLLCEEAKKLGMPLEFNLLGLKENRFYPRYEFWEIAAEVGNDVIIGCDAHCPEDVGKKDIYHKATDMLERLGICPLRELEIKSLD